MDEVKETPRFQLTNIVNQSTALLHMKDKSLEIIIEALKMEFLELKENNSHKTEVKVLKLRVPRAQGQTSLVQD